MEPDLGERLRHWIVFNNGRAYGVNCKPVRRADGPNQAMGGPLALEGLLRGTLHPALRTGLGKRRTFGPEIAASRALAQLHQIRALWLARIVVGINPVLCIEMFVVHAVVVIGKLLGQAIRPTLFRNGL